MERKHYSPEQKATVVLEALQRDTTLEEVSKKYGIRSQVINRWVKEFKQNASKIFVDKRNPKAKYALQGYKPGESPDELKKNIGDLTVQNEILKKVQGLLD